MVINRPVFAPTSRALDSDGLAADGVHTADGEHKFPGDVFTGPATSGLLQCPS